MSNTQPNESLSNMGNRNVHIEGDATDTIIITGDGNKVIKKTYLPLPPKHVMVSDPSPNFVGREREIAQLVAALTTSGHAAICNVKGMGGIGKSELALKVAHELREHFTDQWMLNFRGESEIRLDARDALVRCINDFGGNASLKDDDDAMLKSKYRAVLSGRRALLILDNINHPDQISSFERLPDCALLITSREAKSHYGEVIDLDELSEPEAVKMLQNFAPRVSDDTAKSIVELCGYLPLAIEAIGAYLRDKPRLSPENLAEDLAAEKNRLLEKIDRASLEYKNLNVTASLNISYQGLNEAQQQALRNLSVFPATFDANAAEVICEDEENTLLDDLGKRSLVVYNSTRERFYLHDLVRVFAKNNALESRDAHLRFAQYYLALASAADNNYLSGDSELLQQGIARFELERLNIFAGQQWTANQTDDEAAELCGQYSGNFPDLLHLRLTPREQIPFYEAGIKAARQFNDRRGEGVHLGNLGSAYISLGEVHRCIEYYEQALVISREINDCHGEGVALGNLGNAYRNLGEVPRAIEYYEQALVIFRQFNDRRDEGAALGNLGIAYCNLGEVPRAIEYYEQALVIAREINDRRAEGNHLGNLGNAYSDLGEVPRAIEYYEQALVIAREINDRHGEGNHLGNLGIAYRDLGQAHRAIEYYEQALVISHETNNRRGEGKYVGSLGYVYYSLGEVHRAIEYYEQALVISREINDRCGEGNWLGNLGNAYDDLGDKANGVELTMQALQIHEEIQSPDAEKLRYNLAIMRGGSGQQRNESKVDIPQPHPDADPGREFQRSQETVQRYQTALAAWEQLPKWKKIFVGKPEYHG